MKKIKLGKGAKRLIAGALALLLLALTFIGAGIAGAFGDVYDTGTLRSVYTAKEESR